MLDAMQWMIELMGRDMAVMLGGVIILTLTVEFLKSLKEWMP
jgi:hypothetical protein